MGIIASAPPPQFYRVGKAVIKGAGLGVKVAQGWFCFVGLKKRDSGAYIFP
tara:strand:- start:972 stop:1124 length:153 start_codon:yes stop_codon:yes gene_type:complete